MARIASNILELMGNTPLVRLNKVTKGSLADVLVKLESHNPAGSVKDRIGISMIAEAETHSVKVGENFESVGRIAPYVPHQKVQIRIGHNGHTLRRRWFKVTTPSPITTPKQSLPSAT